MPVSEPAVPPPESLTEVARDAVRRCDWDEALRRWRVVLEHYPDTPAALLGLGEGLLELHRLDEADATLEEALRQARDDIWVAVYHARVAMRRADWTEAVRRWSALRDHFPDATLWCGGLGEALLEAGRVDEADAVLGEGVRRAPDDIWLAASYARVAMRRADWPEAVRRWGAPRENFPDATLWYGGLGEALLEAGRVEEAEAVLTAGVGRAPDDMWSPCITRGRQRAAPTGPRRCGDGARSGRNSPMRPCGTAVSGRRCSKPAGSTKPTRSWPRERGGRRTTSG
jgi:predicted Zn-dependent protease